MRPRRAFTLVELMVVVTVIAIIIAFVLKAAFGGLRQAEQKATVGLIAKLEAGMTDRMDALSSQHGDITAAHYVLAQTYNSGYTFAQPATQRAQVIADYDHLRAELPDVFVVQAGVTGGGKGVYPLNFAAVAYGSANDPTDYMLPLGSHIPFLAAGSPYNYASLLQPPPTGGDPPAYRIGVTAQNVAVPVSGMYGASFGAAAGLYKQLGYGPQGTDGADNNGDGFIDDLLEGLIGLQPGEQQAMAERLARHDHKTARAEVLYAVMIEGLGPLGSVFQRDDFNDREVKDTDGDGLMEFVDAWGEPLQFFRWPILYRSDVQRGFPDLAKISQDLAAGLKPGPYTSVYENREVDTLDANQQLLSPSWWTSFNDGPGWIATDTTNKISGAALAFQTYFHTLADPLAISAGVPSNQTAWDRSTSTVNGNYFARRAYYSRFLLMSGGLDKIPGVAQLGIDYRTIDDRSQFPLSDGTYATSRDGSGALVSVTPTNLIQVENQGAQVDPNRSGPYYVPGFGGNYRNDTNTFLKDYVGHDDITSQNLNSPGGPVR